MYNMEIYCTRSYCIENPYWTRRLRLLVQDGFSIQYRFVQYLSILYITLYNNLLIFMGMSNTILKTTMIFVTAYYMQMCVLVLCLCVCNCIELLPNMCSCVYLLTMN